MKETIALFVGSLRGGGAERAMLDIGRGLAQRGFVVDLVLIQATGPYLADVPKSMRVVALNTRGLLATLSAFMNYLRRRRPSVLLSTLSTCSPGGSREILGNGAWGTLTPMGDHAALAAAISDAMDNPTPPGALKCRASDFAAKSSISAYEETIAAVLNR